MKIFAMFCAGLAVAGGLAPGTAQARTAPDPVILCDAAAQRAAMDIGVPLDVLHAIARVETGRTVSGAFAPWPWTVNQAGDGSFFGTADDAMDHVAQAMANGETNIDIGCFQINVHWHGDAFQSLADMFDPAQNAAYAARFLLDLYQELGTWDAAIGAYHSRNAPAAEAYLTKVAAYLGDAQMVSEYQDGVEDMRSNRYPLLQAGLTGGLGSLVTTRSDYAAVPFLR